MADATDLKSVVRKGVRVRLPPSAPIISITYKQWLMSLSSHNGEESVAGANLVQFPKKNMRRAYWQLASPSNAQPEWLV